ncbi:hypothetical protein [Prosthecomicrobium sp. N25]|uniref:hypothetical protein n=1 Tax=Prosthecomicrobium sp. N25 TaxID=3129254 RepID=UPI0030781B44
MPIRDSILPGFDPDPSIARVGEDHSGAARPDRSDMVHSPPAHDNLRRTVSDPV